MPFSSVLTSSEVSASAAEIADSTASDALVLLLFFLVSSRYLDAEIPPSVETWPMDLPTLYMPVASEMCWLYSFTAEDTW